MNKCAHVHTRVLIHSLKFCALSLYLVSVNIIEHVYGNTKRYINQMSIVNQ